ncbi:YncE family protein [Nesterenkonia haasae]|uniref:YncE family protein n=1 Tax=Nesterenkonia haasae TaxID=2587813 RepID=UPI0013916512|nr:YncE family protein [Nesterenkonia haasae]NDK30543.1 YncE family protein [Nesterenkonia haasae]
MKHVTSASAGAVALCGMLIVTACVEDDDSATKQDEATIPGPSIEDADPQEAENPEKPDDVDSGKDQDAAEGADHDDPHDQELPELPEARRTTFEQTQTISEPVITPKSVVANGHGLAIANNMMYQNSVTVYDTQTGDLVQELPDTINPADLGVEGYPGTVQGAPVEAAWTEDGQYAYVSQYRLADIGAPAYDDCRHGDAVAPSAVFRYSVEAQDWDQFIEVGRVPKYQALTPDESRLLVTNWCDFDLSVIDTQSGVEEMRVPLSSQPRGIAVMPDNRTVYVAAMYANELWKVDLETGEAHVMYSQADFPRHVILSPEADVLYVTFSRSDLLVAFDTETDEVIGTAETGREPRTMDISADGTALYVVNYYEDSVSKFDASTLEEIGRGSTGHLPIGVTYDAMTGSFWVANYSGSITVFDDTITR